MRPIVLNHLGGGAGGIEHFYEQFAKPLETWWTPLRELEFTPEVQQKMIEGLHAEIGNRSFRIWRPNATSCCSPFSRPVRPSSVKSAGLHSG